MNEEHEGRLEEIIRMYEQCDERGKNDILVLARAAAEISERYNKTE